MTARIGLISDVHATPAPLAAALDIFRERQVDTILCAGDIAGYGTQLEETVALLAENSCRTILGNHDLWSLSRLEDEKIFSGPTQAFLRSLYPVFEDRIAGKSLYMVHASPPDSLLQGIKLLDEDGVVMAEQKQAWAQALDGLPYDVLVVGHTHQVFAEQLGDLLVINPGSTAFNHTCAILTLPERTVEQITLPGYAPLLSWNWGMWENRGGGKREAR
ncbi:MAG: metallophosphoesterase family protein [Desulfuromonadales bacterium]